MITAVEFMPHFFTMLLLFFCVSLITLFDILMLFLHNFLFFLHYTHNFQWPSCQLSHVFM